MSAVNINLRYGCFGADEILSESVIISHFKDFNPQETVHLWMPPQSVLQQGLCMGCYHTDRAITRILLKFRYLPLEHWPQLRPQYALLGLPLCDGCDQQRKTHGIIETSGKDWWEGVDVCGGIHKAVVPTSISK